MERYLKHQDTDKYAQCVLCEGCEHFNCANIKDDGKTKYLTGTEKFVCSSCFPMPASVLLCGSVTSF